MARINVEDSLLTDQRFLRLVIKLGSVQHALGVVVWAWRLAQKHYLKPVNDRSIPFNEWIKQGCDDYLIDCGLAEKTEFGILMVGSAKQFDWLLQRQAAGEKSAESRKQSKASKSKKKSPTQRPLTPADHPSAIDHQSNNGSEPLSSFLSSLSSNLSIPPSLLQQVIDHVFRIYPRKQGLAGGKLILMGELKTKEDCLDLQNAVWKYKAYIEQNQVQHIYGFKGFAQQWREWIPAESGSER